ncbi:MULTISPECIES: zinc-finger domain-containing protein [unclassified Wolbachia]|uniref:zinc-finger domain-containing protein n=1 Tax=unclassified Wolbachia TaxID=2640676 RepID=UPI001F18DA04|nr:MULTISPECIES: zinc-finger domain-containing protein [unclassified Wolbachia]UJQ21540.1 zinc-finger domain-containing protein [Wolbachia endosymbiont of Delia radicum]
MSKVRVNNRKVCCHGDENDEGSGHPLIYLDMGEEEEIACPYCEKTFVHDCTVEAVGKLTRDEL